MNNLPTELLASTLLVSITVLAHLIGLDMLLSLTGLHLRLFKDARMRLDRLVVPLGIVLGLFVLHGLEIWIYAFAYRFLDIVPTLEGALYYSTSAYSTIGEADASLPQAWRVLGVLEAVNGMLLIGWSTAFLFQVLHHLLAPLDQDRLPKGAISHARRGRKAS
jgi:energy-coupling factor transporter transmembrane protein EcfT